MRRTDYIGALVLVSAIALACPGTAVAETPAAGLVKLDVAVSTPTVLAYRPQTVYLKVALSGRPLEPTSRRAAANVAIVLDRSGSMAGEKIVKAREAAKMAVGRLGPDDIVSVVAYNHVVDVLVPATKVRDRWEIFQAIDRMFAAGNTALFAGVSKGAYEVRKFIDVNRVNRVVLLSDGLANVGPSSTGELVQLGRALASEGISVTTVGLGAGYNEDLMSALAMASDGNHGFAATSADLSRIFDYEFGDVLSVVARQATVRIRCAPGVRPIRVLGRPAEINGNEVVTVLNQVYSKQEKFLLIELDVPSSAVGSSRDLADVSVRYADVVSRAYETQTGKAVVVYTDSPDLVERTRNVAVMESSVELISTENNRRAVELRDQGKVEQARETLRLNVDYLNKASVTYKSPKLKSLGTANADDMNNVANENWGVQRKVMRAREHKSEMQQAW